MGSYPVSLFRNFNNNYRFVDLLMVYVSETIIEFLLNISEKLILHCYNHGRDVLKKFRFTTTKAVIDI